jgi:hypothetical protein
MKGLSAVIGMVFLLITMISVLIPLAMMITSTPSKDLEYQNAVKPMQNEVNEQLQEVNGGPVGFYYCNKTGEALLVFYSTPAVPVNVSYFLGYKGCKACIIRAKGIGEVWNNYPAVEFQVGEFNKLAMVTTLGNIIYADPLPALKTDGYSSDSSNQDGLIYSHIYYHPCCRLYSYRHPYGCPGTSYACINYALNLLIPVNCTVSYITECLTLEYVYATNGLCWHPVYHYSTRTTNFTAYYYNATIFYCWWWNRYCIKWKPTVYTGKIANLTTLGNICLSGHLVTFSCLHIINFYDNVTVYFTNGEKENLVVTGPGEEVKEIPFNSWVIKKITGKCNCIAFINGLMPKISVKSSVEFADVKYKPVGFAAVYKLCFSCIIYVNWVYLCPRVYGIQNKFSYVEGEAKGLEIIYNASCGYYILRGVCCPNCFTSTIYIDVKGMLYDGGVLVLNVTAPYVLHDGVNDNLFKVILFCT